MPDFPIIDAHLHLYDTGRLSYPWMKEVPALDWPHLPADFRAAREGVEVEAAVFVEVDAAPGDRLGEAAFVSGLAEGDPLVGAMVVAVAMDEGDATQAALDAMQTYPLVRGIRHLIQGFADQPGWCLRESFVEGVASLGPRGLSFDICIRHPQLADATELVRRCPDTRFVLDHIGKPGIRDGLTEPWKSELVRLSRLPNVCCKISGAATEADHANWREEEVAPYLRHAIDCFGFDRVMFGGDWPVSELATRYKRWVALVDAVTANAAPAEKRRLFRETAQAFYRMDGR